MKNGFRAVLAGVIFAFNLAHADSAQVLKFTGISKNDLAFAITQMVANYEMSDKLRYNPTTGEFDGVLGIVKKLGRKVRRCGFKKPEYYRPQILIEELGESTQQVTVKVAFLKKTFSEAGYAECPTSGELDITLSSRIWDYVNSVVKQANRPDSYNTEALSLYINE